MIRPFIIPEHPEEARWVRHRVEQFRFFEEPEGHGWEHGANRSYMQRLRRYWLERYDWPATVSRLNRLPHVLVEVENGMRLHAIHLRSSRPDARPLLIAHGWPGSVLEFEQLYARLAEPEDESLPAFHVVAPSRPGYAWSDRPKNPIGPRGVAGLYAQLMKRLGYDRFVYQGGDWGCVIGGWIGLDCPQVAAIHLNGYGMRVPGPPQSPAEERWVQWMAGTRALETAYLQLQGTKPQSLGFAQMDSPMGLAAWFAEKYCGWSASAKAAADPPFPMDYLLDTVMIYLSTRSALTATWIYRGLYLEGGASVPEGRRIEAPVGVAAFPHDLLAFPPRSMVERGYNVTHWTDMPRGGHFAGIEEPELLLEDLRKFVATLA